VRGFLLPKSIGRKERKRWSKFVPSTPKTNRSQRCIGNGASRTIVELLWLLDQGVSHKALWPISGATVRLDGATFNLDHKGERALTFRAEDRGEVFDLIAWQPRTGAVATWRGQAFCLGDVDDIFNPASYFGGDALRVHATPLDWLLADREGIVIVRPALAPAYLADCQRIRCSNQALARQLEKWLQPRKPSVEILVEVEERAAA
jgi:hypothetical protein